jgi:hypothetical protein
VSIFIISTAKVFEFIKNLSIIQLAVLIFCVVSCHTFEERMSGMEIALEFFQQDKSSSFAAQVIYLNLYFSSQFDQPKRFENVSTYFCCDIFLHSHCFCLFIISKQATDQQIQLLKLQKEHELNFNESFVDSSISSMIATFLAAGQGKHAAKLKSVFKIPDKRCDISIFPKLFLLQSQMLGLLSSAYFCSKFQLLARSSQDVGLLSSLGRIGCSLPQGVRFTDRHSGVIFPSISILIGLLVTCSPNNS